MRVLITGGTGFIGSHLIDHCAKRRDDIFALVRDPGRLAHPAGGTVLPLEGDLLQLPALPSDLDVVFHLAGATKTVKPESYYTVNQKGAASLFEALGEMARAPKVVFLSTIAAGGPSLEGRSRRESDAPSPVTTYGRSKLLGEQEALAWKDRLPVVILRAGAVYGPRDRDFLSYFKFARHGVLLSFGRREKPMTLCYVEDLIRALDLAARTEIRSGEIFNLGDKTAVTLEELGRAAGRALGKIPKRIVIPLAVVAVYASLAETFSLLTGRPTPVNRGKYIQYRQPGWIADVAKSRDVLGFETRTTLEDGIRETIGWYLANGWL